MAGPASANRRSANLPRNLPWQQIETPQGPRDVVGFGPLQDPALLLEGLARYVHTVARFKDGVASRAMGFDLRSVVFTPVLERMKKRAGSLRNMKRFKKCGIEGWLKAEVVAALGEIVQEVRGKGADMLLSDGTELELKAATDLNLIYILNGLDYGVPCLFLGDGTRYKSFPTSDHDDFEVIGCEVFSDGAGQWIVGLLSPCQS